MPVYPDITPTFRLVGSLFFAGATLLFQGLAVLMLYETIAIYTRRVPTISLVTSFEYLQHPVWWVFIACLLSAAFGGLLVHFTHWTP